MAQNQQQGQKNAQQPQQNSPRGSTGSSQVNQREDIKDTGRKSGMDQRSSQDSSFNRDAQTTTGSKSRGT